MFRSHPCRKERVKDGAPQVVVKWTRSMGGPPAERFGFTTSSTKNTEEWGTQGQRRPQNEFEDESLARSSQRTR
jgi:hypothetical protein